MKDDFENLVDFEKKKHFDFFLPYYNSKGWKVLEDNLGKNTDWDIKLQIDGKDYLVDEKARQKEYGDFIAEIVQDLETGNKGWVFKKKDFYFYASWKEPLSKEPSSFYCISSPKLQRFILDNWQKLLSSMEISEK